ncbi:MAG: glutamine-hydrolyzing GMP synthase [Legionellales bacterium]|nr:glutamine-hydrolyzing GMP synthase [Legionellales bacterium]
MAITIYDQRILILDFGSQYSQLIARRVREAGVYCELHSYEIDEKTLEEFAPNGIILSGGPETVTLEHTPRAPKLIFELGCPILGICYGMQTMAEQLGGKVRAEKDREFGHAEIAITHPSHLFNGIVDETRDDGSDQLIVWMSHGDQVDCLPRGFNTIAASKNCQIAAMADEERQFYGVQFHPEVTHTRQGQRIIQRFVRDICGCEGLWDAKHILSELIHHAKDTIGSRRVLLALSGGVDSSVVAALLHQAIGDQLICVFVDNGMLRLHEDSHIMSTFADHLGMNVIKVDAASRFLQALSGVADPETKRKIIGKVFIDIFEEEAEKLGKIDFLAQGTIYPDVIESAKSSTGKAHVIKSHHNVGGLPETLKLKLIEPLRDLFKDEVRKIGLELGLPYDMVYRHPFPGPGLAVRVLGEVKPEYLTILRLADAIYLEELRRHDLYHATGQAFAVFLPVKSVGVKGDQRHYDYVIALRAVTTVDFMTAKAAELPHQFLTMVATRIMNEVAGVSRVVYDISSKPPATIEWE